ncbi:MAG: hypothetical protein UW60_C0032G0010 [Candidatus Woesebacteria bacterium GW2011_GWA2_44_33]|uniref:Uncharacterized protein n=3 Tax=Microgenomates group TaxID=1794810 RepID=A0A0G1R6W9_9BACT|nr:MAG: hypothetical protein UW61_C0036G0006 [Candidatus Curtissbacteria bacterium GW2011_GWC1_44_33]KKT65928.1 MAG: hypothetical protein UW60_C0032G0010 [Candidatus Woesebacteria bacterium GW2011_GWA2_44_33]KKU16630.1 MAG: hypothetical protein UX25_C0028G0012 [Candidatus Woesebacteria bacterium GW2011_GWC2_45_9]
MSCCPDHKEKKVKENEKKPENWFERFLYDIGKKDAQKENNKKCH